MPKPMRTLFTLLLALSLLGGWAVQAGTSCAGPCCVAEMPAPRSMNHKGPMGDAVASGCCCCGAEAVPCDLEQAELPDTPPRALSAAPKVELPAASLLAVNHPASVPGNAAAGVRRCGAAPPGRSPPAPLYLRHLAFLC